LVDRGPIYGSPPTGTHVRDRLPARPVREGQEIDEASDSQTVFQAIAVDQMLAGRVDAALGTVDRIGGRAQVQDLIRYEMVRQYTGKMLADDRPEPAPPWSDDREYRERLW